ncbi:hypothetical protein BDQ17DRAFT_672218 [Cyathus striatus]|nr:hypothetical protein BDQ17DRAFT_672218 [Cyathus striatus]
MAGQPSAPSINSITTLYDDSSSDVPPTPPPKSPGRTFGFPTRPSFSSFASTRQDSGGSLLRPRLSESQSTLNGSETIQHSTDDGESNRTLINSSSSITTTTSSETRKSKSSRFGFNVLRRPSKPQLHNDFISSIEIEPPLPIIHGNRFQASSTTSLQLQSGAKKGGRSRRLFFGPKKKDSNEQDNKEENKVGEGRLYELDDDFEKMDDIVDFSKATTKHRKVGLSLLNLVNKSRIYVRLLMRVTRG